MGELLILSGRNGVGKSTLLKIVAGQSKPTRGVISAPSDAVIAYLPQHLLTSDNCTVMEEASKAFAEVLNMKKEIDDSIIAGVLTNSYTNTIRKVNVQTQLKSHLGPTNDNFCKCCGK